jgi:hypothetical protein
MPVPLRYDATALDLSPRIQRTTTVSASPAAAVETIIATLTIAGDLAAVNGIHLDGWAAYTVGTSGVSVNLQIKRTNAAGTVIVATGALTRAAAALHADRAFGIDTGPTLPGQVYVLTMTVASAVAASTVSALMLQATIV